MTAALVRRILANDLRLFVRGQSKAKLAWAASAGGRLVLLAFLHLPAWALMASSARHGSTAGATELACLFVLLLTFLTGLQRTLVTLWDRGDLPLLLSSPVPARVVVLTRLLDVLVTSCLATGFLVIPLVDVACLVHGWHWLSGYLAWPCATLTITPLALLTTLWTVRHFGVRRTRTLLGVLSIVVGIGIFLYMQTPRWGARGASAEPPATFGFLEVPPLTQLAAAAAGDVRWLLVLAAAGVVLLVLASNALAKEFTLGAQAAAGDGGSPGLRLSANKLDAAWKHAFRGRRGRSLVRKELLLLRRDPLLLARCTTQILTVFPMLVGPFWANAAIGVMCFAMLGPTLFSVTLAVLMTINDEAHELVAASPLLRGESVVARTVAAATIPAAVGCVAAAVVLALGAPLLATITVACVAGNCAALAAVGACSTRPLTQEERTRGKQPKLFWQTLLALLLGGLGAGGAAALVHGWVIAGAVLLALDLGLAVVLLGVCVLKTRA